MFCYVLAFIGLLTVDSATALCSPCTNATGGVVCSKTNDGKLKEFANLCEMNRLNCINKNQAFSLLANGPCVASSPAVSVAKSSSGNAGKSFIMPGAFQYGPRCGNCAGSATSAVCGKNSQGRMVTFVNKCWLQLNNCLVPTNAYAFVSNGYCVASAVVQTSGQKVTAANGVSGHSNIGMINSAECGKLPVAGKILNGQDAGLFQYPWVAYLSMNEPALGKTYACDGAIISPRYVLTAGHCASGFESAITISVLVGEYTLSTPSDCAYLQGRLTCSAPPKWVDVEKVIVHPSYDNNTDNGNDITLLRLAKALDFSTPSVKPVCLPVGTVEETRLFNGEMLTIVGWGVTATGKAADTLQVATVPGISARSCETSYGGDTRINDGQLCAGGAKVAFKDACSGDSGGPLMYTNLAGNKMTEYGLVSYGVLCGSGNMPGVYTRVGFYMKWILDNMHP